jgi:hypothetical protein
MLLRTSFKMLSSQMYLYSSYVHDSRRSLKLPYDFPHEPWGNVRLDGFMVIDELRWVRKTDLPSTPFCCRPSALALSTLTAPHSSTNLHVPPQMLRICCAVVEPHRRRFAQLSSHISGFVVSRASRLLSFVFFALLFHASALPF